VYAGFAIVTHPEKKGIEEKRASKLIPAELEPARRDWPKE